MIFNLNINTNRGFTLIELLVVISIIGLLSSIVLASLVSARTKANDSRIQHQLTSMRTGLALYYSSNNNYGPSSATDGCTASPSAPPWNDSSSGLLGLSDEDNYPVGNSLTCYTNGSGWAVQARLGSGNGNYYCVDYTGLIKIQATPILVAPFPDVSC